MERRPLLLATNDTLSILAKVDTDLLIDDDTTNSPAVVWRDAGENDWQFVKVNGAGGNLTATSDSATSDFQIATFKVDVPVLNPPSASIVPSA